MSGSTHAIVTSRQRSFEENMLFESCITNTVAVSHLSQHPTQSVSHYVSPTFKNLVKHLQSFIVVCVRVLCSAVCHEEACALLLSVHYIYILFI